MITKDEIVKKNLDLLNEFMKYTFDHPDVLDNIPYESNDWEMKIWRSGR